MKLSVVFFEDLSDFFVSGLVADDSGFFGLGTEVLHGVATFPFVFIPPIMVCIFFSRFLDA